MHVGSGSSARAMAKLEDMSCRWQLTKVKWLSRTRRGRRTCTTRRWQTGPNASIPRHAFALLRRVRQTLFPLLPPPPRPTLLLTNPLTAVHRLSGGTWRTSTLRRSSAWHTPSYSRQRRTGRWIHSERANGRMRMYMVVLRAFAVQGMDPAQSTEGSRKTFVSRRGLPR